MKNDRECVKCILVGDTNSYCDKAYLLMSYINNVYPMADALFEGDWDKDLIIDDKPIHLILWDTAGHDAYDRLRPVSYPGADVFMLIFSIISPSSFDRIRAKFYPEISSLAPDVPFIVVGIHSEYREGVSKQQELQSQGLSMVTKEMGQKLAKDIGAQQYLECSGLTQEGLSQAFETAAKIGLSSKEKKKPKPVSLFKWPDFFGKHRKDKDQGPYSKNQPKNIASKPR